MLHLLLEKYKNCRLIQQLRTIKNVLVHNAKDEICKKETLKVVAMQVSMELLINATKHLICILFYSAIP